MDEIAIRPFEPRDRQAVRDICCDGADMGRPIEAIFPDREVAADALTAYYTDHEPSATFVAESGGSVVGYVSGCFDNRRYGLAMFWIIVPCAVLKAVVHGAVFKKEFWGLVKGMARNWRRLLVWRKTSFHSHEGHMHIGLKPIAQGRGAGRRLVEALLGAAKARGVDRITASVHGANAAACGFFGHLGFALTETYPMTMVRNGSVEGYESLYYVKKIV